MKKLPKNHFSGSWLYKLVLQSWWFFCVRKEAMDGSATMLGYPRLKAEVCRLETNMGPPRKIWDNRLVTWRVLLQSFTYIILYYMHAICTYSYGSSFLQLVLWLFAFLNWRPRLSKVSVVFVVVIVVGIFWSFGTSPQIQGLLRGQESLWLQSGQELRIGLQGNKVSGWGGKVYVSWWKLNSWFLNFEVWWRSSSK